MNAGTLYLAGALYLTFLFCFTYSLIEYDFTPPLWRATIRRWLKFLGGLALLAVAVQILTVF